MLPDLVIPWGASGANSGGLHIEICGRANWSRATWLSKANRPMLDRAAAKVAKWCWLYDIPPRWLTNQGLLRDRRGLTTHQDVNLAFKKGAHWDPGPNFPKDWFLERVLYWHAEIREDRPLPQTAV